MPDITVSIGAINASLKTVLEDSTKRLSAFSSHVKNALKPLTAITGDALAMAGLGGGLAGVAQEIRAVIDKGRDLQDVIQRTGQSGGSILKLQAAFRAAHLEIQGVGPAVGKLQMAIAGGNEKGEKTAGVFSALGLQLANLQKLNAAAQFAQIGTALERVGDAGKRAELAKDLFGKGSGGDMLQMFGNAASLKGLNSQLSNTQRLMADSAAMFSRITALLDGFTGKAKGAFGLFTGMGAGIAPALLTMLEKLPKIDLSGLGKRIGDVVAILVQAFGDGRLGKLLGAGLEVGIKDGINFLVGEWETASQVLTALFAGPLRGLVDSLIPALEGLGDILGANLLRAFDGPVRFLQAGIERAIQTLQAANDLAKGKKQDTSGYAGLSDAKRQSMAKQYDDLAEKRFDKLVKEGEDRGDSSEKISDTLNHDAYFQNSKKEAKNLREFDPSKYMTVVESVQDIMERNASEPVRVGTGRGGAGRTAAELEEDGRTKLQGAPAKLATAFVEVMKTVRETVAKFHPADVIKDKGAEGKLSALVGQLQKELADKVAKVAAESTMPAGDLSGEMLGSRKPTGVSSLAKIGGGGYGMNGNIASLMTQQTGYLRQIAETNKALLNKEERKAATPGPLGHAVSGGWPGNPATRFA